MRRFSPIVVALLTLFSPAPILAQTARVGGTVRDANGHAIKGATVLGFNDQTTPSRLASTTDRKGRWAMIGLASGAWTFVAEAPGFKWVQTSALVRVGGTRPIDFALPLDPGLPPGSLDKNVLEDVEAANTLRNSGQYDRALEAYEQIRNRNPKLTSMSLVIADVYRRQAEAATDSASRRALLERAIGAYSRLMKDGTDVERATAEIESIRAEIQALPR